MLLCGVRKASIHRKPPLELRQSFSAHNAELGKKMRVSREGQHDNSPKLGKKGIAREAYGRKESEITQPRAGIFFGSPEFGGNMVDENDVYLAH